jgi:hypothetical protein
LIGVLRHTISGISRLYTAAINILAPDYAHAGDTISLDALI